MIFCISYISSLTLYIRDGGTNLYPIYSSPKNLTNNWEINFQDSRYVKIKLEPWRTFDNHFKEFLNIGHLIGKHYIVVKHPNNFGINSPKFSE